MAITVTGSTLSVTLSNATDLELGGHLTWSADDSKDIGASGANRPRTGYFGTSLVSPSLTNAGTLALSATGANVITLSTNGSERVRVTSDGLNIQRLGTVFFRNNADTDWVQSLSHTGSDMIVLGNTTANADLKLITGGAGDVWLNPAGGVIVDCDLSGADGLQAAKIINSGGTSYSAGLDFRVSTPTDPNAAVSGRIHTVYDGTSYTDARITISSVTVAGAYQETLSVKNNCVLIGGTTNGNYSLDCQVSGSAGTLRVYDQTATTGVTSLVVRAGAGQSTSPLFSLQNNAASGKFSLSLDASGNGLAQWIDNAGSVGLEASSTASGGIVGTYTNHALILRANSTERLRINATGIGFFGATPVAKQTVTADAASILAALQAYGLAV